MNDEILKCLLQGGFSEEDIDELKRAEQRMDGCDAWRALLIEEKPESYCAKLEELESKIAALSKERGVAVCTLRMLYLVSELSYLKEKYVRANIDEERFCEYLKDMKRKVNECRMMEGVCGALTLRFLLYYHRMTRFGIGRLQYEDRIYSGQVPVTKGNITVQTGDRIYGIHIPSGSPLTREACMESLHKAFAFYHCGTEKPLIVHCRSWLLNPDHRKMLDYPSNILDFMDLFEPIGFTEEANFPDAWRVFGRQAKDKPVEEWTEDNRLRKAYKQWLLSGKGIRYGEGLIIFNGIDVLTFQK